MSSAKNEVAQHLISLSERARMQAERAKRTDASRQAFLAARERLKAGELAVAWLHRVASTGASPQVLTRR